MASRAATTHHHTPSKTIGLLLIRELTSKHGYTDAQWLSELQLQSHVPFLLSGRSVTKSEYLSSRPTTLGRYCSALEWTAVPSNSSHTLSADTQWVMLQPVNTNFSARRWCAHVPQLMLHHDPPTLLIPHRRVLLEEYEWHISDRAGRQPLAASGVAKPIQLLAHMPTPVHCYHPHADATTSGQPSDQETDGGAGVPHHSPRGEQDGSSAGNVESRG